MASCAAGTSVAVKDQRYRLYLLSDVGAEGAVDQQFVRQPGDGLSDEGYWGGLAYISARETTVGAQAQHVVIYDVPLDDNIPLVNGSDAVLAKLGAGNEEVQFLKVRGVGLLPGTREKLARTEDVSDENWAERLTA